MNLVLEGKGQALGELCRRYANQYFGLLRDLAVLFGRPVDLVESGAIRNPWFRRGVDASATVLFAA
jgi:hypothetical protein